MTRTPFPILQSLGSLGDWSGIEPLCGVAVAGYDSDLVGVIAGQVGIDEDEETGHCTGQGDGVG